MERHPEVPFWLCVGDVADADGNYESFPAPLYWIKGNNENFDAIAAGFLPENLFHIPNGQLKTIASLRLAGLGGTHALPADRYTVSTTVRFITGEIRTETATFDVQ